MKHNHAIHIYHALHDSLLGDIKTLESTCLTFEPISLKLELDYKLADAKEQSSPNMTYPNEFLYYINHTLVGYLGICHFGGDNSPLEINGMVHPDYRRQGIFTHLFKLAMLESNTRKASKTLLLSDADSVSGQAFIKHINAHYAFSEYEMSLNPLTFKSESFPFNPSIHLVAASNQDVHEIAVQNALYFNSESTDDYQISEADYIYPESEAKRGVYTFWICLEDQRIGKINLECDKGIGGIYGFGILPDYRQKGYGRSGLSRGIHYLIKQKVHLIHLQVESKNSHALDLYKSCGFQTESVMTYSEYDKIASL